MYMCGHSIKPFNDNTFGYIKKPTDEEINKYKLWKCPDCGKWYSLIGIIKGE